MPLVSGIALSTATMYSVAKISTPWAWFVMLDPRAAASQPFVSAALLIASALCVVWPMDLRVGLRAAGTLRRSGAVL